MKATDEDVAKYLSMFTLLQQDQIKEIMHEHQVRIVGYQIDLY